MAQPFTSSLTYEYTHSPLSLTLASLTLVSIPRSYNHSPLSRLILYCHQGPLKQCSLITSTCFISQSHQHSYQCTTFCHITLHQLPHILSFMGIKGSRQCLVEQLNLAPIYSTSRAFLAAMSMLYHSTSPADFCWLALVSRGVSCFTCCRM